MKKLTMCASIAALTLASQVATAGPYSDIYAFGDSLYDSGNFGIDRRATNNAGPDYNTGPSGPIGIQFIAEHLDVELLPSEFGGTNYAVGGHRAADTLASVTADTTYQQIADLDPGKLFNSFFYDLRRNNQTLDTDALFVVEGGGNDVIPGSFLTVADNLLAATQALIDNGANYVVLVDFPVFSKSPTALFLDAEDGARGLELLINNQLRAGVAAIDGNIILLNGNEFAVEFFDDPSAYGFTQNGRELSSQCFDSSQAACQAGTNGGNLDSDAPDPDQFFFNDPLHPTTIGQRISSDYIISVLNAGSELALLPSLAMNSVQAQWQAARPTMRANRWGSDLTDDDSKFSVYGTVQQSESNQDTLVSSLKGENEAQSYHVGVNFHASDNAYFGVLLGRSDNELNLGLSQYV
jgi:outer membrane lipase/esterase